MSDWHDLTPFKPSSFNFDGVRIAVEFWNDEPWTRTFDWDFDDLEAFYHAVGTEEQNRMRYTMAPNGDGSWTRPKAERPWLS